MGGRIGSGEGKEGKLGGTRASNYRKGRQGWDVRKEEMESTRQRNGERKGNIGRWRKRKEVEQASGSNVE